MGVWYYQEPSIARVCQNGRAVGVEAHVTTLVSNRSSHYHEGGGHIGGKLLCAISSHAEQHDPVVPTRAKTTSQSSQSNFARFTTRARNLKATKIVGAIERVMASAYCSPGVCFGVWNIVSK
jgi:hypothetical protein